jgi:hypothetical protein
MRAEVWLRVVVCPLVEDLGEPGGLAASRGQVLLQDEHEDDVTFGGEVRDVLVRYRRLGDGRSSPRQGGAVALRPKPNDSWSASPAPL